MQIFVDIDGTLTVETEGWGDDIFFARTPRLDIIAKINEFYDAGHIITLWTCRHEEDRRITVKWLGKHQVKWHNLILGKVWWDLYICDKSINVENIHELNLSVTRTRTNAEDDEFWLR